MDSLAQCCTPTSLVPSQPPYSDSHPQTCSDLAKLPPNDLNPKIADSEHQVVIKTSSSPPPVSDLDFGASNLTCNDRLAAVPVAADDFRSKIVNNNTLEYPAQRSESILGHKDDGKIAGRSYSGAVATVVGLTSTGGATCETSGIRSRADSSSLSSFAAELDCGVGLPHSASAVAANRKRPLGSTFEDSANSTEQNSPKRHSMEGQPL